MLKPKFIFESGYDRGSGPSVYLIVSRNHAKHSNEENKFKKKIEVLAPESKDNICSTCPIIKLEKKEWHLKKKKIDKLPSGIFIKNSKIRLLYFSSIF